MWLCGWECIYLFLFHFFPVFSSCLHYSFTVSIFSSLLYSLFFLKKIFLLLSHHLTIPHHAAAVVAAGTSGVSGVAAWAQSEDDSGEKTSPVACWGLQWGGSPQGPQVSIWASQGSRWEGGSKCLRSKLVCNKSGLLMHKTSKEIKLNREKSFRPGR